MLDNLLINLKRRTSKNDLKRELYKIQKSIINNIINYMKVLVKHMLILYFAIYCLTPVEHNEEFEELYRELSNNE